MKKSLTILSLFLFSASTVTMFASPSVAMPKRIIPKPGIFTKKQEDGYAACISWCDAHNKTSKSRSDCHEQCITYWSGHAG